VNSIPKLLARLGRLQEAVERERAVSSMAALYGLTKEDAMKQYGKICNGGG
jgi:hypothetical protein